MLQLFTSYLRGEKVWEALAGEAVDVVDRVPLPGQRVHKHSRPRRYRGLCDLNRLNNVRVESSARDPGVVIDLRLYLFYVLLYLFATFFEIYVLNWFSWTTLK